MAGLVGCPGGSAAPDNDQDGSPEDEDCDDTDPWVHPGARESCGVGEDLDCDGISLECKHHGTVVLRHDNGAADAVFVTSDMEGMLIGPPTAFVGDVNGDGADDVVQGLDDGDEDYGLCVLAGPFTGMTDLSIDRSACWAWLDVLVGPETRIATLGDPDGDGYDEFLITRAGWPNGDVLRAGAVHLVDGLEAGGTFDVYAQPPVIAGTEEDQEMGTALATGDVDGDGCLDAFVASPGHGFVFLGPLAGTRNAEDAWATFDHDETLWIAISWWIGAEDLNGDGRADLLISDPYGNGGSGDGDSDDAGLVLAFYNVSPGTNDLLDADLILAGTEPNAYLGGNMVASSPLGRDANAHLLVPEGGGREFYVPMPQYGRWVVDEVGIPITAGEGWQIGFSDIAVGDFNGDHRMDFLIDAETSDYRGAGAFVLLGAPTAPTTTLPGDAYVGFVVEPLADGDDESVGFSFRPGSGDVDSDAYADLWVRPAGYDATYGCGGDVAAGCNEGATFLLKGGTEDP